MSFPDLNNAIATKLTQLLKAKRKQAGKLTKAGNAVVGAIKDQLKTENAAVSAVSAAVSAGIKAGTKSLEITGQIAGHAVHANPVTWAAKPWLAAWDVKKIQDSLEKMYAICDGARNAYALKYGLKETYECTCATRTWYPFVVWDQDKLPVYSKRARTNSGDSRDQTCADLYKYFVSQKESKSIRVAVGVFLPPVYMLYAAGEAMRKKEVISSKKNDVNTRSLIAAALPMVSETVTPGGERIVKVKENGCQRAQAIIALWLGELELSNPSSSEGSDYRTIELMIHPDGYEAITGNLSSGLLLKTG